jgi:hypothetical protein
MEVNCSRETIETITLYSAVTAALAAGTVGPVCHVFAVI